ncbi:MAG: hypothetical protein NC548_28425 [Lachnospiraceae bacterium]|nr:hypothetical protein [Lachnospiraceae bacterium]MCM1232018.1 hypothetical protein [Ruminococcus flavefaciens]
MELDLQYWTMIDKYSSLFIGSLLIIGLIYYITEICYIVKTKRDVSKVCQWISIIFAICILILAIIRAYISDEYTDVKNRYDSYNTGIEFMSNEDWYNAAVNFSKADNYEEAESLMEYCYFIYVLETHPDWVPNMGINEITGGNDW